MRLAYRSSEPLLGKMNSTSEYNGSSSNAPNESSKSFGTGARGITGWLDGIPGDPVIVQVIRNASLLSQPVFITCLHIVFECPEYDSVDLAADYLSGICGISTVSGAPSG